MLRIITKGATSQSVYFEILDSASTTGGRKTGIVFNSAGLTAYYARNGAAAVSITLVTLASASAAWSSGGFVQVDATNMPGIYRLDVPNAAFATGVDGVIITVKGASGMVQVSASFQLVSINLQDAVRGGMTALPNANAQSSGGLFTMGTGAGQINQANNGQIDVNSVRLSGTTQTARDLGASVLLSSGTGTGQVSLSSGAVLLQATQTGVTIPTVTNLTNAPSDSSGVTTLLSRLSAARAGYLDVLNGIVASIWAAVTDSSGVTTLLSRIVGTLAAGTHNAQSGDSFARLGAPSGASVSADIADVATDVNDILVEVDTEVAAIKVVTDQFAFTVANQVDANALTGGGGLDAAGVRSAVGLASANLDTQLTSVITEVNANETKIDTVDTVVDAIKAKTDNLTFTVANKVDSNALNLNGSATAANRLERSARAICLGVADTGSSTTSIVTSSLDPSGAVTDQFKGRIVIFDENTSTASLRGQGTDITGSTSGGVLTVTALTTAPQSGDTFTIV